MIKANLKTETVKETVVVEKEVKTVCLEMDLETAQMLQDMLGYLVIDEKYQIKIQKIYHELYNVGISCRDHSFWENLGRFTINSKKVRFG